ncbi:KTSC domain-containing protein [Mesorhizobium sp. B1-1-8]|uniref:KTSC domain-containing protein n=1 Tax=Mesorhizobium sp. B1-1-8 TaxID=2589976 RepID=UPI00112E7FAF|nr:KTSC domain-containing protein [Mesorhizobium sp. B1-1-8]
MPSTAIRNTYYDPSTKTLSVWFVPSGNRYDYEEVEPETYAAFKAASSKGRFFNEFVRDRYKFRLVEQGAPDRSLRNGQAPSQKAFIKRTLGRGG